MFTGISMRQYSHYNMTPVTRNVFLPVIELIAGLCETYVFLLLGVGVAALHNVATSDNAKFVLVAAVFCLIGRAIHVYPFSWFFNRCSSCHDLSVREQHMVWYAG